MIVFWGTLAIAAIFFLLLGVVCLVFSSPLPPAPGDE